MSEKLWFGSYKRPYDETNARFYNVAEHKWATDIEAHWDTIKEEIKNLIDEKDRSFISNASVYKGVGSGEGWSSLSAIFWGLKVADSIEKKCPRLFSMLNKAPGLTSVSFSRLEPHTVISEHHGETNAIIRCHLGIEIPGKLPDCGLKAGGEERSWEEGKWLFFNDAQHHSAWNNTDKRRIVLIVDVIRPEFLSHKNFICARILTGHFMTVRENKGGVLKKMPRALKMAIYLMVFPVVYVMRPLYNALHLNRMYHE